MKKNMIQLFSRVAVLLWTIGFATAAHAQATLGMENNLAFHLGENQVAISMDNSVEIANVTMKLYLPTGMELVEGEEGLFDYTDRIPMNASFSFDPATVGAQQYKFMLSSMSNTPFVKGSSTFFSFTLKATEALAETSIIRLNQFVVSDPYATAFKLDDDITISVTNLAIGNENVYEALAAEIAALQQQLDDAKAQVAEEDADVAEDFEDHDCFRLHKTDFPDIGEPTSPRSTCRCRGGRFWVFPGGAPCRSISFVTSRK